MAEDLDNGVTLCLECHIKKHPWMKKLFEKHAKDEHIEV